ncbi:substrate-binding domain-containing protein [Phycisphaerales bacterium AB-hyl4]|uniref:Substrate-binding domain-containing protein n=1 Tax=Natronomicrosphaera hydrolytica TaxID=3242702 RepID=A0ABV4U6B4_9BACT
MSEKLEEHSIPCVLADNEAIAQIALEHFQERGYAHLGYSGGRHRDRDQRGVCFQRAAEAVGLSVHCYDRTIWESPGEDRTAVSRAGRARWLESLPHPIGILCWSDLAARTLAEACASSDLRMPEDVAILGVDNDVLICEMTRPSLSSIELSTERIGFESARLLDSLMGGEWSPHAAPDKPIPRILPAGVVARASTDHFAVSDPDIVRAVRYIREYSVDGIGVEAVAEHAGLSRRSLERHFKRHLGCTPLQVISRVRLERICRLLSDSDVPLARIAEAGGFQSVRHLHRFFRQQTGSTPTSYRRLHRFE